MGGVTLADGLTLHAFDGEDALLSGAATWLSSRLQDYRSSNESAVALTGGNTARGLYRRMVALPEALKVTWRRRHWFWGDERFVAADHPDSNFAMAQATLLAPSDIPNSHIHTVPVNVATATESAVAYGESLREFYGANALVANRPLFDVVLLSLGADGHIASLFPGSPALAERTCWVAAETGREQQRVSLTLPALESARTVILLAAGASKRPALCGFFNGAAELPISALRPLNGIHLFSDVAALAGITAVQETR